MNDTNDYKDLQIQYCESYKNSQIMKLIRKCEKLDDML